MSSKEQADALGRLFDGTGLFQTVQSSYRDGHLALIGRVMAPIPEWLQFVKALKKDEESLVGPGGLLKVMQDYILKDVPKTQGCPDGKKIVFAWVVQVGSSDTSVALKNVERRIRGEALVPFAGDTSSAGPVVPWKPPQALASNVRRRIINDGDGKQVVVEEQDVPLPGVAPGHIRNAKRVREIK